MKEVKNNSYKKLKTLIDNYISHMEIINNKRLKNSEVEMEYILRECKLFQLLKNNIDKIEANNNGISEDK